MTTLLRAEEDLTVTDVVLTAVVLEGTGLAVAATAENTIPAKIKRVVTGRSLFLAHRTLEVTHTASLTLVIATERETQAEIGKPQSQGQDQFRERQGTTGRLHLRQRDVRAVEEVQNIVKVQIMMTEECEDVFTSVKMFCVSSL